jgi:hypothetical protein
MAEMEISHAVGDGAGDRVSSSPAPVTNEIKNHGLS